MIAILSWTSGYCQSEIYSFDSNVKTGDTLVFKGKYAEAIKVYQNLLESNDLDSLDRIVLLNRMSAVFCSDQDYKKASLYANRAKSESVKINANDQEAEALDNQAAINVFQRINLDEAGEMHEKALQLKKEYHPKDSLSLANSYYNIARLMILRGTYKIALDNIKLAISLVPSSDILGQKLLLGCWYGLGVVHYFLGDHPEALRWLNETIELADNSMPAEGEFYISVYNLMGGVYSSMAQEAQAASCYSKSLLISEKHFGKDHLNQAATLFNMGYSYYLLNELDKAAESIQKSLDLYITFEYDQSILFHHYMILGEIYNNRIGIEYQQEALEICRSTVGEMHWKTAMVYSSIANVYFNQEKYDTAFAILQKSLKIQDVSREDGISIIEDYNLASSILIQLRRYEDALHYNDKSIQLNKIIDNFKSERDESIDFDNAIDEYRLLTTLQIKGDIFYNQYLESAGRDDLDQSVFWYRKAAMLVRQIRKMQTHEKDKMEFSKTVKYIYAQNIAVNVRLNEIDNNPEWLYAAFNYSEKSKSYTLRELLNQSKAKVDMNLSVEIIQTEKEIDSTIASIQTEILTAKSEEEEGFSDIVQWKAKLFETQKRRDSLEQEIETLYPQYYQLKYLESDLSVDEVQSFLPEKGNLLEFFVFEDKVFVFVISREDFRVNTLNVTNLKDQVQRLRHHIIAKNESAFATMAHQLYESLLAPVRESVKGDELTIIPDGILWHLPFGVLLTEPYQFQERLRPPYLLNDYAVGYANSVNLLLNQQSRTNKEKEFLKDCIAFSYSAEGAEEIINHKIYSLQTFRNSKVDLPGSRIEIDELSKMYDGQYYYQAQASESNFKTNVKDYRIVHLALHGDIDDQNSDNSRIYFFPETQDDLEDNILYSHELPQLDIPAELVVLNACSSGTGVLNEGEGILSLGRSFQHAGARSLVLSKWEVSDKTSPELMKYFYSNLRKGMRKSKALQKAQLEFLETSDAFSKAPFYWANFFVLGNNDPISIHVKASVGRILLSATLIIGIIGLLIFGISKWRVSLGS